MVSAYCWRASGLSTSLFHSVTRWQWLSKIKSMTSFVIKLKTENGLGNIESYRWICMNNLFVSAAHTVPLNHHKCFSVCSGTLQEYVRHLQGGEGLPFQLEIRLCSQLNSCFLHRKHRTIDNWNLDFFERQQSYNGTNSSSVMLFSA